jgi:hypothetical protein
VIKNIRAEIETKKEKRTDMYFLWKREKRRKKKRNNDRRQNIY